MCGVCGAVQLGGPPRAVLPPHVLEGMLEAIRHRGPDDRGVHVEPGVALGARRLSIIDVEGGHQPFGSEDERIWAVQNGEIYNHVQLRAGLEGDGHRFRSRCDTEVIPHLYEHAGVGFVEQLRGMFAIAIWDGKRRQAVLARDRLGIKPLYYAVRGDLLLFASELKSLLASGLIGAKLDADAIDAYFTLGFVPGPMTLLEGVSKLEPGQVLVIDDTGIRLKRYWEYPVPAPQQAPFEECRERLLDGLEESVRLRMMSDVPFGAMLSGGLDSSMIVALMARNSSQRVKTFSVGFAEDRDGNELSDARRVASALGTDHHELELSVTDTALDLEALVWWLDEPVASLSALGFLELSRLAARHVTVALSGQGADELLGGYRKHLAAALIGRRMAGPLRAAARGVGTVTSLRENRALAVLGARDAVGRLLGSSSRISPRLRKQLFLDVTGRSAGEVAIRRRLDGLQAGALETALYLDAQLGLVDDMLHYFDRTSMAHSLEVRVPFLDHQLVEYCATIPGSYKIRGLTTKHVLREAARGLVPRDVIERRKVSFFHGAIQLWVKAQLDTHLVERLLAPSPRYAEFLDEKRVRRVVEDHRRSPRRSSSHFLLSLLMLELWLDSYLPLAAHSDVGARATLAVAR